MLGRIKVPLNLKLCSKTWTLKYKNETKFLGLYLTEDVKWDVHIKHVCNILNKNHYVIHSLKNVSSIKYFEKYIFCKL